MRSLLTLLFFSLLAPSCSKENNVDQSTNIGAGQKGTADEGVACKVNGECSSGACIAGFCRVACDAASGCLRASAICLYQGEGAQGGCSLAAEDGCKADADCGPFACGLDGRCRSRCTAECKQGQYCVEGACYDKTETGVVAQAIQCIEEKRPQLFCEGAQIVRCNAPGKPGREPGPTCATPALCAAAVEAGKQECAAAACKEGERRCNPTTYQIEACSKDQTGFVPDPQAKACQTMGLCKLVLSGQTKAEAPVSQKALDAALQDCSLNAVCTAGLCHEGNPYTCNQKASYDPVTECGGQQCDPLGGQCFSLEIDAHEASRADYQAFLAKGPPASVPPGCAWNTDYQPAGIAWPPPAAEADLPVVGVDWCDARAYCESQGKRLCGKIAGGAMVPLSEAANPGVSEWMNACSSGGEFLLSYGDQYTPGKCNSNSVEGKAAKVGAHASTCASPRASYQAISDLIGNVAEWENSCEIDAGQAGDGAVKCSARGGHFATEFNKETCDIDTGKDRALPRSTTSDKIGVRCCG